MVPTKIITTMFDSMKLFFDMWFRHHGMFQNFIINDRTPSLQQVFKSILGGDKIAF
jgi:hypothetical protein